MDERGDIWRRLSERNRKLEAENAELKGVMADAANALEETTMRAVSTEEKLREAEHYQELSTEMGREVIEEKERVALTDSLTGLPNRRALEESLNRSLAYSRRYGTPLSFLMLDIDRFKAVNDTYGHAAGDKVLKAVAETFRKSDVVGRWGGEEFAVVLENTDAGGAQLVADRIREQIAGKKVSINGDTVTVTVSIGISTRAPDTSLDAPAIVKQADMALYRAKVGGRNKVEAFDASTDTLPPEE